MKAILAYALAITLAGTSLAFAIEPIPGSITYHGQPRTKLKKAPVGSPVEHQFYADGRDYRETYIIQPDRTLMLVERHSVEIPSN